MSIKGQVYFRKETEEIKTLTKTFHKCAVCRQATAGYATYGLKQEQLVFLCNEHNNRINLERVLTK